MPDLNNYRLIKRLSSGLIDTFIAENIGDNREQYSVVKVFNLNGFTDRERQYLTNLLTQTASNISKIQPHPQVAKIINFFEQGSAFYIVENYFQGHGLDVEITPGKLLSESYAIALLQNALVPLDWLHQQNIVHGNIHPGNLIRRQQDGKIILTDIGAVKQVWQGAIFTIKPQPQIIPRINYLPPGYPLDTRTFDSDIYGLGAIAIQAMSGLPIEQLVTYPNRELIIPRQLQISRGFSILLRQMVSPHTEERFKSVREVLVALAKVKEEVNASDRATINLSNGAVNQNKFIAPDRPTEPIETTSSMPKKSISKVSLFAWIAANFAGISLGYYLSWIFAYLGSFIAGRSLVSALFGLSFGFILGICQGLVIKGVIQKGCWWVVLTTLGGGLGFFLGNLGSNLPGIWGGIMLGGISGLMAGFPQSLILQSELSKGRLWWASVAIAGAISGLIAIALPDWGIAIGGIIFGIVTGMFLK